MLSLNNASVARFEKTVLAGSITRKVEVTELSMRAVSKMIGDHPIALTDRPAPYGGSCGGGKGD